jgi:RNA polymerase sigma factor (sigma-70 family)
MPRLEPVGSTAAAQAHRWPLATLIEGARLGKDAHIGELCRRFQSDLYATLFSVAPDVAWDAISETLMALPRLLQQYEDDGKFLAWLRVLVWNRARTIRRSHARRREEEIPEGWDPARTGSPMRTVEADMMRRQLLEILTPEEQRMWEQFEAGASSSDVALALGKTPNAVDQWRYRVRQKLQKRARALLLAPHAWPISSQARTRREARQ